MSLHVLSLPDERDHRSEGLSSQRRQLARPRVGASPQWDSGIQPEPFLRIPPFPGCEQRHFAPGHFGDVASDQNYDIVAHLRTLRVGGAYWGAQPELPPEYLLVRSARARHTCERLESGAPTILWEPGSGELEFDPWHMLSGALALVAEEMDEAFVIAAIMGVPAYLYDESAGQLELQDLDADTMLSNVLVEGVSYANPFTGDPMTTAEAVELCGFWRRLIDSNRDIGSGLGFAFWKQDNVAPLLWGGSRPFAFLRTAPGKSGKKPIAVWRSRASPQLMSALEQSGTPLIEVEDGFLRSEGLGADCVPPLSITVDRLGAYFDPAGPSELELLLQDGEFDEQVIARARRLRKRIVEAGLGKYERGCMILDRPGGDRPHILVPGQVEDDRSVQKGGAGLTSNLELLVRVREQAPDAHIIYKPHPDVLAGHRKGAIAERICLEHADQILGDAPISSLIAMVDEVHVNTSLAGFEALMRGKAVTTYGVPFYAGWGLTRDLGPVPSRRSVRRTIDELVAATLLLYPRYVDPLTRLPCPAEIVVDRLCAGAGREAGLLVTMRRVQGRLMRRFRSILQ